MTGSERIARYAALGPCIGVYETDGRGQMRVYEMMADELELKFVAVPLDGAATVLPFFTLDGCRDHARRESWKELAAA